MLNDVPNKTALGASGISSKGITKRLLKTVESFSPDSDLVFPFVNALLQMSCLVLSFSKFL
jgi:hypothetical protein